MMMARSFVFYFVFILFLEYYSRLGLLCNENILLSNICSVCIIVHIAAAFINMLTLMMKNNCNDDDIGSEFYDSFNLDNTIENVHSQNNKLELAKTGEFNQYEQTTGFSLPCGDLQYGEKLN